MSDYLRKWFGLHGQVAIVTGASRGIGAAIADALAEAGAVVIGVARSKEPDHAPHPNVTYVPCDVTDIPVMATICEDVFNRHKRIDILVNVAGVFIRIKDPAERMSAFDGQISANLRAAYGCAIHAAEFMKRTNAEKGESGGCIVNITSVGGLRGFPGMPGYAASKGGLQQLTLALAADLAPAGIRVHNIAPGYILTDMNRATATSDVAGRERRLARILIKRPGETSEVAAGVVYLASAAGAYLTGQTLHIDGGWTIQGNT